MGEVQLPTMAEVQSKHRGGAQDPGLRTALHESENASAPDDGQGSSGESLEGSRESSGSFSESWSSSGSSSSGEGRSGSPAVEDKADLPLHLQHDVEIERIGAEDGAVAVEAVVENQRNGNTDDVSHEREYHQVDRPRRSSFFCCLGRRRGASETL
jgi:hypothetical protein